MALLVSLTLESPLLVGRERQGDVYQSFDYLPGSVLRGAVAEALMAGWSAEQRAVAHPDDCPDRAACPLCRLLYPTDGPPPRFGDCYPAAEAVDEAWPFPLTAHTCKRQPGFLEPPRPGKPPQSDGPHGIFDTLLAAAAADAAARLGLPLPYHYRPLCPTCGEETKPAPGSFGLLDDTYLSAEPINRRFSRTAINRRRHTAQDGQLFTLTVMGERMGLRPGIATGKDPITRSQTRLVGHVEPGGADAAALTGVLAGLRRLGSGPSRGLGQVSAAVEPAPPTLPPLAERLAAFNAAVGRERAFYAALGVTVLPAGCYFTLDLTAAAFFRRDGLPALCPTAEMLGLPDAKLVFAAVEPIERGGWVNAWGLPRERRVGAAPGAVFLFRVAAPPAGDAALLRRLAALEAQGLGDDTERGAGRLLVCAPFHLEVNPR